MARLDQLAPAKEVAQIGAAIGREFFYDVLAAVAARPGDQLHGALGQLVGAGLVFRRGMPPEESFIFKHAFVQDAAYDTLLRAQRKSYTPGSRRHSKSGLSTHIQSMRGCSPIIGSGPRIGERH
jgi:predicted ATPase